MIGRVVTALAGRALARQVGGAAAGRLGAAAGVVVPMVLPRVARILGPWGMVGAVVGGWAIKRAIARLPQPAPKPMARQPIVTPPPIPMVMAADY